ATPHKNPGSGTQSGHRQIEASAVRVPARSLASFDGDRGKLPNRACQSPSPLPSPLSSGDDSEQRCTSKDRNLPESQVFNGLVDVCNHQRTLVSRTSAPPFNRTNTLLHNSFLEVFYPLRSGSVSLTTGSRHCDRRPSCSPPGGASDGLPSAGKATADHK